MQWIIINFTLHTVRIMYEHPLSKMIIVRPISQAFLWLLFDACARYVLPACARTLNYRQHSEKITDSEILYERRHNWSSNAAEHYQLQEVRTSNVRRAVIGIANQAEGVPTRLHEEPTSAIVQEFCSGRRAVLLCQSETRWLNDQLPGTPR